MSEQDSTAEIITVERRDHVATVHLRKPSANAIDTGFARKLCDAVSGLAADGRVRAAVLTGHGRFFSAGLDLKVVPRYTSEQQAELMDAFSLMIQSLYGFPKPLIAAVNGHAVAGGLLLVLTTDWRIASDGDVRFGLTGARAGIAYPVSARSVIDCELAPGVPRNSVLTGRVFGAAQALKWDIIDEVVSADRVLEHSLAVAAEYAVLPGDTYEQLKTALHRPALERMAAGRKADRTTPFVTDVAGSAAASLLAGSAGPPQEDPTA